MRTASFFAVLFCLLSCRGKELVLHTGDSVYEDNDGDGFDGGEDCDDSDALINPDASEVCDGVDNDCDGYVDDEDESLDTSTQSTWYVDSDSDGYGVEEGMEEACEAPEGMVEAQEAGFDCDDSNPLIHPDAEETDCSDPTDYNCDGSVAYDDLDGDGWPACTDCNDGDAAIHPEATEVCDELDNDCDSLVDDDDEDLDASTITAWYADADGDGYGDETLSVTSCTAPSGFVAEHADGFDCDDSDPDYHPGAEESDCTDGNDYNCDGSVAYEDADLDGFAACMDCNDADAEIHPDATEVCDDLDNDCDGDLDDADADVDLSTGSLFYEDADADGFGDPDTAVYACLEPSGYVSDDTDCDDSSADTWPGADEYCDGIDTDCDGTLDEDDALDVTTWYADEDEDGFGNPLSTDINCSQPDDHVQDNTDCDDSSADTWPGATEYCDGVDTDCDGTLDEDDAVDVLTWYADTDGDGYGDAAVSDIDCAQPSGYVADGTDCDDSAEDTWPGAPEYCDGVDTDCDGTLDEDEALDVSTWYADTDGDGYGDAAVPELDCAQPSGYVADATDCDDSEASSYPGATEYCDGVDSDCDGTLDEDEAVDVSTWYADTDGDSYGDASVSDIDCAQPSGYVADDTDCDDATASTNPGATEYCDGVDNDCDGQIDEGDADDASTWYADSDGDGYGDGAASTTACSQPSGYLADATDCDDSDSSTNPGADEYCDGHDDDCDGDVDEDSAVDVSTWYADSDGDGYGSTSSSTTACDQPSGYAASSDDCDDSDISVSPGASEVCDGLDNDCDGTADSTSACGCYVEYYGSKTYLFCTSSQSWDSASSTCQNLGYHLITIGDGSENSWADSTADSYSTSKWHIGFTDQWSEGNWQWADGSSVTYTNWHSGEPNGGTSESCAQINRFHPTTTWNDEPCGQGLYFICEYN